MSAHPDSSKRSNGRSGAAGFTLVEVLVALMLLTTALVPAFVLATNAVALSTTIRDSLIASGLAQEGVEVIRAMRDANWFSPTYGVSTFDAGLDACLAGCRVEWNSTAPLAIAGNPPLKLNAATGLYQYTSGADTLFHRQITVTQVSAAEIAVISTVTWRERNIDKTTSVEYHLFDWVK